MTKKLKGAKADSHDSALPKFMLRRVSEGSFILVLTAALFVLLALLTFNPNDPGLSHPGHSPQGVVNAGGQVGAYVADALYLLFGYMAYLLPVCFAFIAWLTLKDHRAQLSANKAALLLRGVGLLFLLMGGCGLLALEIQAINAASTLKSGGMLGQMISSPLAHVLNIQGATLLLSALFLVGLTWLTGFSWIRATELIGFYTLLLCHLVLKGVLLSFAAMQSGLSNLKARKQDKPVKVKRVKSKALPKQSVPNEIKPPLADDIKTDEKKKVIKEKARKPMVSGVLPPLALLNQAQPGKPFGGYTPQELETLSREVEQHLLDFGIQVDVVSVHPGPVITRFELQLAAGVKASKLTALSKDLARSLSVNSVRVVEIIPGKTVVGIELPNQNRATVNLSEVLNADVYQKAHSPLTLALGVDIAGYPMVVDLAKMPHLLVAGTTGSGKSVGINAMILSLLLKATPETVRLIMVDPKMLELSVYDGIPHLLTPVVTDMKEAASALRWCVGEMERRYRLMASFGVRNLAGFNAKVLDAKERGEPLTDPLWKPTDSMDEKPPVLETLPYIVVVIDELADMMMVVGKKVEQLIARIAQKARAAGIHLILATQRPSVDVLTGLIKSNIPTRISFQVSSKIDSRTILDQQGAEQLLGYGDMLFLAPGGGAPLRVHGAFVDDKEVHLIADDWRARGTPDYIEEITQNTSDSLEGGLGDEGQATEDSDPLYDQVVQFVIETRKASISAVQRRFKIGYNRAARLVEEMESKGIVGPLEGGFRDILVSTLNED